MAVGCFDRDAWVENGTCSERNVIVVITLVLIHKGGGVVVGSVQILNSVVE